MFFDVFGFLVFVDKWFQCIVFFGGVIGMFCSKVVGELGLLLLMKVVQGGVDVLIGMIGFGVVRFGQFVLIIGFLYL